MEGSLEVTQNVKNETVIWSSEPTFRSIAKIKNQ